MNIAAMSREIAPQVVQWRRDLHRIPELGLQLPQTAAYVKATLTALGISYDDHYLEGNGIVAIIEGQGSQEDASHHKVLALRADMDGLPIKEETGLPFASTNGCMHACGHDGHTAVLLGVAKILQEHRENWVGVVKLIFQPGEELPGGAKPMIEAGALKHPQVTRIYGFHQGLLGDEVPPGTIQYRSGNFMAAADVFTLTVEGKGGHGGYPESTLDPITCGTLILNAFQTVKSRRVPALSPCVISVTHVSAGTTQNVIPDQMIIEGTVRTFDEETRYEVKAHLMEAANHIAEGMGLKTRWNYIHRYPAVVNHPEVTQEAVRVLQQAMGEETVQELSQPRMSSEDFAYYLQEVPGTFLYLSNPGLIEGAFHGHHHAKFDIDESQLSYAVEAFLHLILGYFSESVI